MTKYPYLSKPLQIKSLSLPNRIVMAPMSRYSSPNGVPGQEMVDYYQRRAMADVGLIITESIFIDPTAVYNVPNAPISYGEEALMGWKNVVDAVHSSGGKIAAQLMHSGGIRQLGDPYHPNASALAPSAIAHPFVKQAKPPKAMSLKEIEKIIGTFVESAKQAKAIGFDALEIHGAHGFLIDQFFWELTNQRKDHYGGKQLKQRTRFAYETIQAVRKTVGVTYPISFRFSQWKLGDYEAKMIKSPQELSDFLFPLIDAGVDIFNVSTRHFDEPAFDGDNLSLATWTKKLSGKTAIAVGSVGYQNDFVSSLFDEKTNNQTTYLKIDNVEENIAEGNYDLIAIGRPLLADPQWWQKVFRQQFEAIKSFSKKALVELY